MLEAHQRQMDWLREQIDFGEAEYQAGHVHEENDDFWEGLDRNVEEALTRGDQPSPHVPRRLRVVLADQDESDLRDTLNFTARTWGQAQRSANRHVIRDATSSRLSSPAKRRAERQKRQDQGCS